MRISDWSSDVCSSDLLVHAQRQLSDPQRGPDYFNRLRNEFDKGTINGERVRRRLRDRQTRAAAALANSDVDLSAEQLQIVADRSEEHTSELQSLMRTSYAVFCLKKKNTQTIPNISHTINLHNRAQL